MDDRPTTWTWPPVTYWMKVTAGALVVVALSRMVVAIQQVLILVIVSLILGIGLQPTVSWLVRRGMKRGLAVATIGLTGFAVIGGFLALIVPTIISQIQDLIEKAPEYVQRAQEGSGFIADVNERFDLIGKIRSFGANIPSTALSIFKTLTSLIFNTLTVVILTLYFTSALPRLQHSAAQLLKREGREQFESILAESTERVGAYLVGNLLISLIAGVVTFIAMLALGVPYAAALAFWVALTDLVPTVGALLGAALAIIVAAFAGPTQMVGTIIFFAIYQQIENYVIGPRVMKRAVEMSAAAVIVAIMVGGSLAGFVGALLALPVAAIIKIAARQLYIQDRLEEVAAETAAAVSAPPVVVVVEQPRGIKRAGSLFKRARHRKRRR